MLEESYSNMELQMVTHINLTKQSRSLTDYAQKSPQIVGYGRGVGKEKVGQCMKKMLLYTTITNFDPREMGLEGNSRMHDLGTCLQWTLVFERCVVSVDLIMDIKIRICQPKRKKERKENFAWNTQHQTRINLPYNYVGHRFLFFK